jgi:hypothetical protein
MSDDFTIGIVPPKMGDDFGVLQIHSDTRTVSFRGTRADVRDQITTLRFALDDAEVDIALIWPTP